MLWLGETTVSEEKKNSLEEALDWVDVFLKDKQWVAGPNLTIADTAFLASISGIMVRASICSIDIMTCVVSFLSIINNFF